MTGTDGRGEVAARLKEAQAAGVGLDVTIRPSRTDQLAATALAKDARPDASERPRALPRITIDRRLAEELPGDAEVVSGADLELVGVLGEGGMGVVYVAEQHSLARQVALKVPRRDATRAEARALVQEGVIAGQLEHPGIVPVHALGLDDEGRPALVMKLIDGVTWSELLEKENHPGWEGWPGTAADRRPGHLEILARVCDAMRFAHSRGVVHRDLKPQNILIGGFGDVYVADWGVAIPMGEGVSENLCGTLGYMAPEMACGDAVDERTDVYLLGAILHEVLTGQIRHDARTAAEAIELAVASTAYAYVEDDASLGAIANRACHLDPGRRYHSVVAFRDALLADERHAASRRLLETARGRVAQAQALARLDRPDEAKRRAFERASIEARFGLDQAREQWPDNPDVAPLEQDLDGLLEAQRRRAAELEELAHQRDRSVGAKQRLQAMVLLSTIAVALSLAGVFVVDELTTARLFYFGLVVLAAISLVVARWRRQIAANAFSRQVLAIIFVYCAFMVLHRWSAMQVGTPPAEVVTRDALMAAAVLTLGGVVVARWVFTIGLLFTVASALMLFRPAWAVIIYAITSALGVVIGTVLVWREQGAPPRTHAPIP